MIPYTKYSHLITNLQTRTLILIIALALTLLLFLTDDINKISIEISKYPDGKDFALSITDDPDYGWLEQKFIVYNFLSKIGFKTTIPVWVLDNKHGTGEKGVNSGVGGITTTNKDYLTFTKSLQRKGFEIALHTVSPGNDYREETILGYELFKDHFGQYPIININHTSNIENIYWGGDRFSNKVMNFLYSLKTSNYFGHVEQSKYFWGDILSDKTKYVRGWATDNINTLSINESMPYHLEDKPYVNYWFSCSDGYKYNKFIDLISIDNINKLKTERGTSIIYTHFGYGFVDKTTKNLSHEFITQMTYISQLDGWLVPVSTILDRFILLRNIEVVNEGNDIVIINKGDKVISGLTILTNQDKLFFFNSLKWLTSNASGEIILGDLPPFSVFKLGLSENQQTDVELGLFERINIIWNWIIGRYNT